MFLCWQRCVISVRVKLKLYNEIKCFDLLLARRKEDWTPATHIKCGSRGASIEHINLVSTVIIVYWKSWRKKMLDAFKLQKIEKGAENVHGQFWSRANCKNPKYKFIIFKSNSAHNLSFDQNNRNLTIKYYCSSFVSVLIPTLTLRWFYQKVNLPIIVVENSR